VQTKLFEVMQSAKFPVFSSSGMVAVMSTVSSKLSTEANHEVTLDGASADAATGGLIL
jgi:hypothetical protein